MANGTYQVTLKLAAPAGSDGNVFNVNAERQRVLAEAGQNTALDRTLTVAISDGVLGLEFVPQVGAAIVSAIAVS